MTKYEIIIASDEDNNLSIRYSDKDEKNDFGHTVFTEKELKNLSIGEIVELIRKADNDKGS